MIKMRRDSSKEESDRNQLVSGPRNSTAVLLEAGAAIEATAKKLPYVSGY